MTDFKTQIKVATVILTISGLLSILGSSMIIFMIKRDWKYKITSTYHRLMFGLSSLDLLSSFAFALSSLPSPKDAPLVWFSYGNRVTCSTQGILFQIGYASIWYNVGLALYFLLKIRYRKSESWIKENVEKWMHFVPILMAIVPIAIGIPLRIFNNVGAICYVGAYPLGCDKSDKISCQYGESASKFFWGFGLIPLLCSFFVVCASVTIVWWTVWRSEKQMSKKYLMNSQLFGMQSMQQNELEKKEQNSRRRKLSSKTVEVRNQAIRYVTVFVICFLWPLLFRLHSTQDPTVLEVLRYCSCIFQPLQGILNFFNYIYLRLQRMRSKQDTKNIVHAFYLAIYMSEAEMNERVTRKRKTETRASRWSRMTIHILSSYFSNVKYKFTAEEDK